MLELKRCKAHNRTFDPKMTLLKRSLKHWFVPVDEIRDYYGEEIAIYFEWMNFFLRWMIGPAILGLVSWILNQFFFDPEKSPLNAFFAIFMSIWSALFAINWRKHERSLTVLWDNLYQNEHKIQNIREEFIGNPEINPVSEKIEPHYPESERFMRYVESLLVSTSLLFVIFVYLICMYNLTGVIVEEKWNSIFYIDFLGDLAKEGGMFDANTNWNFIPSIAQTVLTMLLNSRFRNLSKVLTNRENHKYESTYDNSLIIKRFSFEFFDCFLPLIYLGWYELDFKNLRQTVVMIYVVDEFRRVATESLLPYLT